MGCGRGDIEPQPLRLLQKLSAAAVRRVTGSRMSGAADCVSREGSEALHPVCFESLGNGGPVLAIHIKPFPEGLVRFRLRAEPEHVAVNVLHLHFVRPRLVCRWMTNLCAGTPVLFQ
jgi:hypothetical protein